MSKRKTDVEILDSVAKFLCGLRASTYVLMFTVSCLIFTAVCLTIVLFKGFDYFANPEVLVAFGFVGVMGTLFGLVFRYEIR